LPDAADFGVFGADTLRRISKSEKFNIPTLLSMGIGNIDGVDYLDKAAKPTATVMRLMEKSLGKDTTTGHWEIAGIVSKSAMPTYPNGFPKDLLDEFSKRVGRGVLCNLPYSGTDVIRDFGEEHLKSGDLIVYTSADSVFQIAANEDIVPPQKLYEYCRIARGLLKGEHAVGRVIARPFVGTSKDNFKRTANRKDFSLEPTGTTMLDAIKASGKEVVAIGKITDIFAGVGVTKSLYSHSNKEGMELTESVLDDAFEGLVFTNLVDFDMLFGHRQDIDGYANALSEFDAWLSDFSCRLKDDDILMITADHGCDPGDESTDHTREHIPLIVYGKGVSAENLGTRKAFSDIAASICDYLGVEFNAEGGESFFKELEVK
jgi:phosphopentomutase